MNQSCSNCGCAVSVDCDNAVTITCGDCRSRKMRYWILALTTLIFGISTIGCFVFRAVRLNRVPDIGSPFADSTVKSAAPSIDPGENAFLIYDSIQFSREPKEDVAWSTCDWADVPETWKTWLNEHQAALALLNIGSSKRFAMHGASEDLDYSTMIAVGHNRAACRLALLNASRHLSLDDFEQSWHWLRVAFRHSRHCSMAGSHMERLVGSAFHSQIAEAILVWASHHSVDISLLTRALDDVRIDFAMTPQPSVSLRNEYYFETNIFELWFECVAFAREKRNYAKEWFDCEPERGRRLINLVFANWMHQVDLPIREQVRLPGSRFGLFVNPFHVGLEVIDAERLEKLCQSSAVAIEFFKYTHAFPSGLRLEQSRQSQLEIGLIAHCHFRERGSFPANNEHFETTSLKEWPWDSTNQTSGPIGYRSTHDGLSALIWCAGYDGDDDGGTIDTHPKDDLHDVGYLLHVVP